MSDAILNLVAKAKARGLVADEGEWSKAFVYWFGGLMPSDVREAGSANAALEYFCSEGTPHTPAGEGFIDRATNTSLSFLMELK